MSKCFFWKLGLLSLLALSSPYLTVIDACNQGGNAMPGQQLKLSTPVGKEREPAEYVWVEGERTAEAVEEKSVRVCQYLKKEIMTLPLVLVRSIGICWG